MTHMRQTQVFLKFVVVLFGLVAFSARAEYSDSLVEKRDAQAWLKKIQYAGQKLNYSGTFVYQQGNQMRTSRITHMLDGKNEIEKLEVLDGKPREYIRNNEEITCYIPESRTVLIEKRLAPDFFPAMLAVSSSELAEHYEIKKGEGG